MRVGNKTESSRTRTLSSGSLADTKAPQVATIAGAPVGVSGTSAPLDLTTIQGIPQSELTPRVRVALDVLMVEVQDLRGALSQAKKRVAYLENLADQDTLAPVLNRRAFVRELARMISFAERYGAPGSVLYFDIDGMKAINDKHGHAAGDLVVKHAAEALLTRLRGSDFVGRLGGDEFGVVLTQADQKAATAKAQSLAQAIQAEPIKWNGEPLNIRISHGIYTFAGGEAVEDALDRADQAMYMHKRRNGASSGEA